jgi:hypothetical protein
LTRPGNSNVNSTGIARSPGKIKVAKVASGGMLHPAGEDNPVPGAKRKIIARTSVVIARNRPVRNLISSRDQAMLAAADHAACSSLARDPDLAGQHASPGAIASASSRPKLVV